MAADPNFPPNLDIHPLVHRDHERTGSGSDRKFDASAQEKAIREYGIAGRVWEAAYALKTYLNNEASSCLEFDPPFVSEAEPSCVLELGSGTGVVVAQLAELFSAEGDVVVATDLPEVCTLLEKNLEAYLCSSPLVLVRPLSWGNLEHALKIHEELSCVLKASSQLTDIVCSDLVYFPELLAPLLRSLIHLTSPPFILCGPPTTSSRPIKVTISYKIRSLAKETAFWSAFGLWFTFEPVLERRRMHVTRAADALISQGVTDAGRSADNHDSTSQWRRFGTSLGGDMFIFVARRRTESLTWTVPETDEELLCGVGAWGTSARKGDGAFESLLLMSMDTED